MGRMEGLIGLALGRSPYDEQVASPPNLQEGCIVARTGQRYDDQGRPINPETRQLMRDHIRASNEVMQAAGIIEETADVQARAKAFHEAVNRETEIALRRLEFGRVILVAGVWGVCGFRRRILLYQNYSGGLLDILRQERAKYSALHIFGAGLPALAVYQCIEWLGLVSRAVLSGPNKPVKLGDQRQLYYRAQIFQKILDYGFGYVMLNYQMFAIIQQLNIWPSDRLLPSLRSLIPFSAYSPLRLPPLPSSLSLEALWPWATTFFLNMAPLGLVMAHSMLSSALFSLIFDRVYNWLPKPAKPRTFIPRKSLDIPEMIFEIDIDAPSFEDHDSSGISNGDAAATHSTAVPSHHAATLEALEGRSLNRDDSSDEEDHEISQQTLITFDVEATEMTESTVGTWSAELRSANEPLSTDKVYRTTASTLLPPLLAAQGLSTVLSGIPVIITEMIMVRTVAHGYRTSAGLGRDDLFSGIFMPWEALISIFAVDAVELAVMGVTWAAITIGFQGIGWKHLIPNSSDDTENED